MKKVMSFILVVFCFFGLFAFSAQAEEETAVGRAPSHVMVGIETDGSGGNESYGKNMVRNPYYQKYYNELINYSCQLYYKSIKTSDNNRIYIELYAKQYIVQPENYTTLIFREPEKTPDNITEYNRSILRNYFTDEEILYVSDYDYAAIVCIADTNADIVNNMPELEFLGDAFFTNNPNMMMPAMGIFTMGNVLASGNEMGDDRKVTAADARFLLRYVAGLEEVGAEKQFYFCADMNFDNKIDAADARLVLRTAAGLEPKYYMSYGYFQFWEDYMGVIKK